MLLTMSPFVLCFAFWTVNRYFSAQMRLVFLISFVLHAAFAILTKYASLRTYYHMSFHASTFDHLSAVFTALFNILTCHDMCHDLVLGQYDTAVLVSWALDWFELTFCIVFLVHFISYDCVTAMLLIHTV